MEWNVSVLWKERTEEGREVQQGMRGLKFWVLFSCHPRSQVAVRALVWPPFQSPKTSCPLLHSRGNSKLHVWKYKRVLQSNTYICDCRISCERNKLNVPITPQPIPTINNWSQEKDKIISLERRLNNNTTMRTMLSGQVLRNPQRGRIRDIIVSSIRWWKVWWKISDTLMDNANNVLILQI